MKPYDLREKKPLITEADLAYDGPATPTEPTEAKPAPTLPGWLEQARITRLEQERREQAEREIEQARRKAEPYLQEARDIQVEVNALRREYEPVLTELRQVNLDELLRIHAGKPVYRWLWAAREALDNLGRLFGAAEGMWQRISTGLEGERFKANPRLVSREVIDEVQAYRSVPFGLRRYMADLQESLRRADQMLAAEARLNQEPPRPERRLTVTPEPLVEG